MKPPTDTQPFSDAFLDAFPAFRGELSAGDLATGRAWFAVWQAALARCAQVCEEYASCEGIAQQCAEAIRNITTETTE